MNWKYKLNQHGKNLRNAINNGGDDLESCKVTLKALKDGGTLKVTMIVWSIILMC